MCCIEEINDIVDLKRYLNEHHFSKYIMSINGLLKTTYSVINIYLSPDSICLKDDNGNFICLDEIQCLRFKDNIINVSVNWMSNDKYINIICCQYK